MHFQVSLWKCQADLCPRECTTKWLFSLQEKMCSQRSKHHLVFLLLMAVSPKVSSKNLQIVTFTYFNIFRGRKFHDSYIFIKSNTSPLKWVQHAKFFCHLKIIPNLLLFPRLEICFSFYSFHIPSTVIPPLFCSFPSPPIHSSERIKSPMDSQVSLAYRVEKAGNLTPSLTL